MLRSVQHAVEYVIGYMLTLHGIVAHGFLLQGSMQCNGPPPALTQGKDRACKEFFFPCHRIPALRDAHSGTSYQPIYPALLAYCLRFRLGADPRFFLSSLWLFRPCWL